VGDERALDFCRAEPEALDLEEIVGATGVPEKSIFVLKVFIAGAEPLADEGVFCSFVLIPIAGAEGIALDPKVADFIGRGRAAGFVGDFCFEAGENFAAGAGL